MTTVITWSILSVLISALFLLGVFVFQQLWNVSNETNSAFECGIDPFDSSRVNLFMHFFFIALLFVVFDLEVAVVLPLILSEPSEITWSVVWFFITLVMFLGLGLEVEICTLEWNE